MLRVVEVAMFSSRKYLCGERFLFSLVNFLFFVLFFLVLWGLLIFGVCFFFGFDCMLNHKNDTFLGFAACSCSDVKELYF